MWAAWWGKDGKPVAGGKAVAAGEGQEGLEADAGGGRMGLGVCLADGKGGLLCLLGEKCLARACFGEDRTKTRFAFPAFCDI